VNTVVPLLTPAQRTLLPERAREIVEYRKSGLSLNHIQGCPLDCAYCIRHTYGLWDQRQPRALMDDAEAVALLVGHRYFQPHVTPGSLTEAKDLCIEDITERAALISGLSDEQPRYYLQHALGFQMHDVRHPHQVGRHGRAYIGWEGENVS